MHLKNSRLHAMQSPARLRWLSGIAEGIDRARPPAAYMGQYPHQQQPAPTAPQSPAARSAHRCRMPALGCEGW